ncbi:hypothetical protein T4C_6189 [Trichinella pseudospiralis]|uniref:Uncharacterized protein n=1 Tax=Trichinella pseudospiralis TaxID=6337 RepID=A0A0V1IPF8_TRIPS|nr:hypothetical protein T4C_6189 [Trichinella pseudospiralis]
MVMLTCGQLSYGGFIRELEMSKLTSIAEEDIVATLFTYGMLAKEHEEYWIVISETFGQADGKLNLSERRRRIMPVSRSLGKRSSNVRTLRLKPACKPETVWM